MAATEERPELTVGWVVWARLDGSPWWPGYVVRGVEYTSTKRSSRKTGPGAGSVLVRFFNDSNREASLGLTRIRDYTTYVSQLVRQNGEVLDDVVTACNEAHEFIENEGIEGQQRVYAEQEYFEDLVNRLRKGTPEKPKKRGRSKSTSGPSEQNSAQKKDKEQTKKKVSEPDKMEIEPQSKDKPKQTR